MDSPPLAFTLLSDGRLLLLALTVVAVASFVSLSIFGYADRGRANRRTDWLLLAVVCGAFGLWAAHFFGGPETAMASSPLQLILAAVAAGTVLVMLLLGALSRLIDRRMMRDSVHNMQQLVDAAIEGIVVAKNDRIVSVNQRLADLCSVPRAELIGKSLAGDLIDTPIDTAGEALLRTASGVPVPVNVVRRRLSVGDDVYTIHDLTERRAVEMELQRQNKALQEQEEELRSRNLLLDTALMHMSQGLCMYDKDQRVVVCNERYATLYRLTPEDVKPGSTRRAIVERRVALGVWGGNSPEAYLRDRTAVVDTSSYSIQEMNDGRSIATAHVPMPGGGWVCTHEDITERRQAQAKIEHLARHDGLTNLPNRVLVRERLQEALSRLRPGEGLAVHAIDLDRFKEVNDALGHVVGDELLQAVAERFAGVVSEVDTLARMGADEYVIVQNPAFSPTDASDLASQIIAGMNEPFTLAGRFHVVLGVSIGIAMAPGDGTDADQLLKDANLALYRAKEEERGKYRFFEREMDARMRARHDMERNLRNALANGELDLDYQPLLNLKRSELSGFEALMRWRTPDGVVIPPCEFIPLAEETGLIVPWASGPCVRRSPKPQVAAAHPRVSQPLAGAVQLAQPDAARDERARHLRRRGEPARARDHRVRASAEPRDDAGDAAPAARPRRAHSARRLRHRLLLAELPAQLSLRQDQDRPVLHRRARRRQRGIARHRACGRAARREPRRRHHGGGRRDAAPARDRAVRGLHRGTGVLGRQAEERGGDRRGRRSPAHAQDETPPSGAGAGTHKRRRDGCREGRRAYHRGVDGVPKRAKRTRRARSA